MRIHTGEKPFTCHICGQRYARGDYLRAHIQAHRRDKIHKCKHCGEVFHDLTRFADHCRQLHRDMDDEFGNPRPPPETSPPPPVPSVTLESTLAFESAEEITVIPMNEVSTSQMMPTSLPHSSAPHTYPLHPHPHSHPHPHATHPPATSISHDMIQMTLVNIADPTPSPDAIITSTQAPPPQSVHYNAHDVHIPMQGIAGHSELLLHNGQLPIPDTANEVTILSQPKSLPAVYGAGDPLLQYIISNGSANNGNLSHSQPLHHQ